MANGLGGGLPNGGRGGFNNPMTAQDDLIVGGSAGVPARLAKGAGATVLTVDPTTLHLGWATPAAVGMANPMTAAGDLIVGGAAGTTTNQALAASGATATQNSTGGGAASLMLDNNDATKAEGGGPVTASWKRVDLGSAKAIVSWRFLQETAGSSWRATSIQVDYSNDDSTWTTTQTTVCGDVSDTGTVAVVGAPITARYWRFTALAGGGNGWNVFTLQINTGLPVGNPVRLAVGAAGKVPVALSDGTNVVPTWDVALKKITGQTVGTSQATIAHGLGYTPTIVIPGMTSAGTIWRSAASDATNCYLTADAAARTCDVYVR